MSTKIYTGFCMRTRSWPEAHSLVRKFQKEVIDIEYTIRCTEVAEKSSFLFDLRMLGMKTKGGIESEESPFMATVFPCRQEEPPKCSVCFYPFRGAIFGTVHSSIGSLEALWLRKPHVKLWPYWNNTDAPNGISDAAWDTIGAVWDKIFGYDSPETSFRSFPCMTGLCIECLHPYGQYVKPDDVIQYIPDLFKRAESIAKEVLWQEFLSNSESGSRGNVVEDFMAFQKWCRHEGSSRLSADSELVRKRLKAVITKQDILTGSAGE